MELYGAYGSFQNTNQALEAYEQALARGQGVAEAASRVGRALLEDWNQMARKSRMVLALDTLERLVPLVHPGDQGGGYPFWTWLHDDMDGYPPAGLWPQ